MWGSPRDYAHIATRERRQVTLVWDGPSAVAAYERLASAASLDGVPVETYLRRLLE
jgi:hypothetical protein